MYDYALLLDIFIKLQLKIFLIVLQYLILYCDEHLSFLSIILTNPFYLTNSRSYKKNK